MKRGYRRLLIFEIIIITILLLNNFVSSILSGYLTVIFLLTILGIFYLIFGFEKDRHRYWQSICLEVIIFLLSYFLIYYLSGLIFTFYRVPEFLAIKAIIPLFFTIIVKEYLRYMMVTKSEGSILLLIVTCILFVMIDLIGKFNLYTFETGYQSFMFIASLLLPYISKNVLCTYMSYKSGFRPTLLYYMVMELYIYLIPIVPNPNDYLFSVIQLVVPFILLYRIYIFFKKDRDEEVVRVQHKHKIIALIPSTLLIIVLVYLTSGYFYYHAVVVGSGSMWPNIRKGDVVIIEKKKLHFDDFKIGDVLAVKKENIIIIHRLAKKIKVGSEHYYYTKGDANNDVDNYKVTDDMIVGIVNKKIPYIGYPTVWLRNL